jgi:hypothetical protein
LIRQGEAEFDRRLLGLQLLEAGLDALAGPLGRMALPLAAGPGMQGLDAPQLLHQLMLGTRRRSAALAGLARSVEAGGLGSGAAADGDLRR